MNTSSETMAAVLTELDACRAELLRAAKLMKRGEDQNRLLDRKDAIDKLQRRIKGAA
jgi:hypothetical protein